MKETIKNILFKKKEKRLWSESEIFPEICSLLRHHSFVVKEITLETNFLGENEQDLNLHILEFIGFIVKVELHFEIKITDEEFEKISIVLDLVEIVLKKIPVTPEVEN